MVSVTPPVNTSYGNARDIFRVLFEIGKRNPLPLIALAILIIIANTRVGLYMLALGGITQALIDQDRDNAITWALVSIGAGLMEQLYWPFRNHLLSMVEDDAAVLLQTRVLRRAANVSLERYEHASFFNALTRANDDLGRRASLVIAQFFDLLQLAVMFVGLLAPLWFLDPRIAGLAVLGCIPVYITTWKTARSYHEVKARNAPNELYATRIRDLILQRDAATELRLFGTGQELAKRWLKTRMRIAEESVGALGVISRSQLIGEVFAAFGLAGAIAILVQNMMNGTAPLGSLVAVVFSIVWAVDIVGGLAYVIRLIRENSAFLGDIFTFEAIAGEFEEHQSPIPTSHHGPMRVQVENATFRYPEAHRDVVQDINLHIEPGEHIAIVGENGAGKSTLVRLIAGSYTPTSGYVLQDNEPALSNRKDIGAVFQDFVRWQLPLRDNVGFGDVDRRLDDNAILSALERADLQELPEELETGLDSWLGREFGERDLSGGQWQRIAIARAFFLASRLLILDEPTAALDPLAEQRLFERFRDLAAGKTAITISHRIGSARTADRIVVMEQGQIIEVGSHADLVSANGRYATMLRMQREWYKQDE